VENGKGIGGAGRCMTGAGAQGAAKKKVGDPRGGWVGQRPKKEQAGFIFWIFLFLCSVFGGTPLTGNSPKTWQRKPRKKNCFRFLVEFFVKTFRHDLFYKTFFVVVLNSHRLETPETRNREEALTSTSTFLSTFLKKFSTWTFCKNVFLWCI
jgi:hypothetical protein